MARKWNTCPFCKRDLRGSEAVWTYAALDIAVCRDTGFGSARHLQLHIAVDGFDLVVLPVGGWLGAYGVERDGV